MTNKLEEVFKELQESHVLVDREEYEKLIEKAKKYEEEHLEIRVGEFYKSMGEIFKVVKIANRKCFTESFVPTEKVFIKSGFVLGSNYAEGLKKAKDEEIKLFKRAEMYHKHGRKLDELKVGDLLINKGDSCEIYQVEEHHGALEYVEDIIAGLVVTEIYLTVEEQQEAHKKIVGE